MEIARVIVWIVEAYLCVGALVGLAFILFGIDRVDASAHGALAFRPLLLPGFALLWPLGLARWRALARQARGLG